MSQPKDRKGPEKKRQHIIVTQYDPDMMKEVKEQVFVIKTNQPNMIEEITEGVRRQNRLFAVMVKRNDPLTAIRFKKEWRELPIAWYLPTMGILRDFMAMLPVMRNTNSRFFLTSDRKDNFTNLRLMASLGVSCGIYRGEDKIDWDMMNDLMTYAVYSKGKHAPIEPFNFIVSHYNPRELVNYRSVYFDNPEKYLHMDKEQNIALTMEDLEAGKFIAKGIKSIADIRETDAYQDKLNEWQEAFLSDNELTKWPGWRLAQGNITEDDAKSPACKQYFTDLMDACDFFKGQQENTKKKVEVWQP